MIDQPKLNMKKRNKIAFVAVMLMIATVNYSRISGTETIRPIHFLSIFAIGLISGILLKLVIEAYKNRQSNQ